MKIGVMAGSGNESRPQAYKPYRTTDLLDNRAIE